MTNNEINNEIKKLVQSICPNVSEEEQESIKRKILITISEHFDN
jgi:hypothetical protein